MFTSFNLKMNVAFVTLIISREDKTFPLFPEAGYADWGLSPFSLVPLATPRDVTPKNTMILALWNFSINSSQITKTVGVYVVCITDRIIL
jgi:hypothetical protein